MQNSYQICWVISNPFLVKVFAEKETYFTATSQKKYVKVKKKTCKSKAAGIVAGHGQLSTTAKQNLVNISVRITNKWLIYVRKNLRTILAAHRLILKPNS